MLIGSLWCRWTPEIHSSINPFVRKLSDGSVLPVYTLMEFLDLILMGRKKWRLRCFLKWMELSSHSLNTKWLLFCLMYNRWNENCVLYFVQLAQMLNTFVPKLINKYLITYFESLYFMSYVCRHKHLSFPLLTHVSLILAFMNQESWWVSNFLQDFWFRFVYYVHAYL